RDAPIDRVRWCAGPSLDGVGVPLAGADAHHRVDGRDPDLPVADLVAPGGPDDRVHAAIDEPVVEEDLELQLRDQVRLVLGAPVDLGVATLATRALDLGDGDAADADPGQRRLHLV